MSDDFLGNGSPTAEFMRRAYGDYEPGEDSEVLRPGFDLDAWGINRYATPPEPTEFLISNVLPVQTVGLLVAQGGIGKSYMMMDICISLAAGPSMSLQNCLGGHVLKQCKAVLLTGEDSFRSVNTRLHQLIDPSEHRKLGDRLRLVPMPDAGGTHHFMVTVNGKYQLTMEWEDMFSSFIKYEPEFIGLDPLSAFSGIDINSDPAAAQTWYNAMTQLSSEVKSAVLTTHHMRKTESEITSSESARLNIRGTSALTDGARWVYCLWPAPLADRQAAESALGRTLGPIELVMGAVVKSNEFGMTEPTLYLRDPDSGLLRDTTRDLGIAITEKNTFTEDQLMITVNEVNRRWERGEPFSRAANTDRWLGGWMIGKFQSSKPVVKKYIQQWISEGHIKQERHHGIRANGLRGGVV